MSSKSCLTLLLISVLMLFGCSISGTVTDEGEAGVPDVNISIGAEASAITNEDGYYISPVLPSQEYIVTPSKGGYLFTPESITVTVEELTSGGSANVDFVATEICVDNDADGYGDPASDLCTHPEFDCDDSDGNINPDAVEACDGVDNNCDGQIDIDIGCEEDNDHDGYAENEGDCEDQDKYIYPGRDEICGDELDNNCDGMIDDISCTNRFTDLEDGTIRDNKTGLIWLKDAGSFGNRPHNVALEKASQVSHGFPSSLTDGSSPGDWRLPTAHECDNFVDRRFNRPALSNTVGDSKWSDGDPFVNVAFTSDFEYGYWSSSVSKPADSWYYTHYYRMSIIDGVIGWMSGSYAANIWPVRSDN